MKRPSKDDERRNRQSNFQIHPATAHETNFRHSAWAAKRAKVFATLQSVNAGHKQLESFENCGAVCCVEYDAEQKKARLRGQYCRNRHCEPCQRAKANLLAANLREKLEGAKKHQYRFVTLTLRHTNTPLADQIKRLYKSFRSLRATTLWKATQTGGAAILEVKWSADRNEWHPHLHVVAEGGFLKQQDLSAAWLKITGDSDIVDVRSLNSGKDAAHYVAKYVSKGTNDAVWSNVSAAQEWVIATKGVRTAATYGRWRGFKLLARKPDSGNWKHVGSINGIVEGALRGDRRCKEILSYLNENFKYNPHRSRGHHNEQHLP